MTDVQKLKNAQTIFLTVCEMLDDRQWRYQKDAEKLKINCSATGDDLPIDIRFHVDAERDLVMFLSSLNFSVPEEMRETMVKAVSMINYSMVAGSFDFNPATGGLWFRLTSSYRDSLISKAVYDYMLGVSCSTVDEYNDKLLMIAKGNMSLQELKAFIEN